MKSYDKQPNNENIETALKTNSLNLNNRIFKTAELLDSLDGATSICLDGKWGSGKTFFVKELQLFLDCSNEFSEIKSESIEQLSGKPVLGKPHATVYFDAWENDLHQDPLLSLIYVIARQFSLEYKWEKGDINEVVKKVFGALLSSIPFFGGTIDVKELMNGDYAKDFLGSIKKEKNIQKEIKDFFSSLTAERGDRILIIIDELDRCRPDYAIQLLERIKHYMNCEQVTFLFAMNATELESIVKKYYGQDFNATGYLDKFFDLRLSLPPISIDTYLKYIGIDPFSSIFSEISRYEICKNLQFEKREINRFYFLTDIAIKKWQTDFFSLPEENSLLLIKDIIIPYLLGLRLKSTELYEKFINGQDCSLLQTILNCGRFILLVQNFIPDTPKENINSELINTKIKEYCNALFTFDFTGRQYRCQVGDYVVDQTQRDLLFNAISIVSDYADFN